MVVGPFRDIDTSALVGPFRIIDIMIWQMAIAMGLFKNIDIYVLVGPFRFLGDTVRQWLWAHSRISTSLFWLAHSGLLTLIFSNGYGPTQEY
jgi:hypothetical protein